MRVAHGSNPGPNEAPDLRSARHRERLTWHAAGDQVDALNAPCLQVSEDVRGIGQVTLVAEAPEIVAVGSDSVGSESAPTRTVKPASWRPRLRPPGPENRSIAVGRWVCGSSGGTV